MTSASPGHRSLPRSGCAEGRAPADRHLSRYRRRGGRATPRGGGVPSQSRPALCPPCPRCARPQTGGGGKGPSRAPRSRRRSPSAGCRRASLAPGPASTSPHRGDAVERCWLIPRQSRLKRDGRRRGRSLAAPLALYCKTRWSARNAKRSRGVVTWAKASNQESRKWGESPFLPR